MKYSMYVLEVYHDPKAFLLSTTKIVKGGIKYKSKKLEQSSRLEKICQILIGRAALCATTVALLQSPICYVTNSTNEIHSGSDIFHILQKMSTLILRYFPAIFSYFIHTSFVQRVTQNISENHCHTKKKICSTLFW